MSRESAFIARLAAFARHPAARDLADDVAVLSFADRALVLTHDMIVEGVHYLASDPPGDVAWKAVAVNLSDLAAKGAAPRGILLGYPLAVDEAWDAAFAEGMRAACAAFDVPLLGGDTVSVPAASARQIGVTAIGEAGAVVPARSGARAGDLLYVSGEIGAAGLGLAIARGVRTGPEAWLAAYRRPLPRLTEGTLLAPLVHAMADISDGLLIDARRMAAASGLAVAIDLDAVPLPDGAPGDRADRLAAATAGDDYELLCAGPAGLTLPQPDCVQIMPVGHFTAGHGLTIFDRDGTVPLPGRLGYEHGS